MLMSVTTAVSVDVVLCGLNMMHRHGEPFKCQSTTTQSTFMCPCYERLWRRPV